MAGGCVSNIPLPQTPVTDQPFAAELALSAWELADIADEISLSRFSPAICRSKQSRISAQLPKQIGPSSKRSAPRSLSRFPADVVAGEEYGGVADGVIPDGRIWIIDPIDGTKNYVRGVPVWATLIGLVVDGQPTRFS